jgi:hypothetical protein
MLLIFFGIFGGIALLQWKDKHWIKQRFGPGEVVIMSFGVTYYGCESVPGKILKQTGVLILLKYGLLFRTRFFGKEFKIPKESIKDIYATKMHKGKNLYQYVLKIDFVNSSGGADSAAFRVPFPKQWMTAIENVSGMTKARAKEGSSS